MKQLLLLFVLLSLSFISLSQTQQSFAVVSELCGNGTLDPGEVCDDGNLVNDDGCDISCMLEVGPPVGTGEASCGNGVIESPEQCDDGNDIDFDGCDPSCVLNLTIQTDTEPCEAGDFFNGVGCEICPEGSISETGATSCMVCSIGLTPSDSQTECITELEEVVLSGYCGDTIIGSGEICDDGNTSIGSGCSALCDLELGATCVDTTPADGTCDTGGTGSVTSNFCGNGLVAGTESCDDGNEIDFDVCDNSCLFNIFIEFGITCDEGKIPNLEGTECIADPEYIACSAGTYLSGDECVQCAPGMISYTGSTSCVQCDSEFSVSNPDQNLCLVCPYMNHLVEGMCAGCSLEQEEYCINGRLNAISGLDSNYISYCGGGISEDHTQCMSCDPGSFDEGDRCHGCIDGAVFIDEGVTCEYCPAGTYQTGNQCIACDEGFVSGTGFSFCYECSTGWSYLNEDQNECIYCEPGQFASGSTCVECSDSSPFCVPEPPVFVYHPEEDIYELCPIGANEDLTACIPCPVGTSNLGSTCGTCSEGAILMNNLSYNRCEDCPAGTVPNNTQTGCIAPLPHGTSYRATTPGPILTGLAQQPNQIINNYINTIKRKLKRMIRIPKL